MTAQSAPAPQFAPFSPGPAEPARLAKLRAVTPALDAFFESKFKESGATGFAVGVIVDGELAYERGFGVRDVASGTPIDSNTVFRMASLTKSFTALAVLKLRDEGKLALDDPAAKYLREFSALVGNTRDAPPISLRLLLSNASGLAYDDLWGAVTFGKSDAELGALLRSGVQLSNAPGTKYAYSNLGWALLGRIVERVSGRPYRSYVAENILRPLGINSAAWEGEQVPKARLATGYRRVQDKLEQEARPLDGAFAPAGGLYMSLRDYARYAAYNLAAYPARDDAESGPVRRSTLREMHAGQRWARPYGSQVARLTDSGLWLAAANYGFGWLNVVSCNEESRVQHGGFEPGYFGWVVLQPVARIAFVALSTTGPAGIFSRFGVFDILRGAGLLEVPAKVPHPALVAAEAAIASLLTTWDPALAERTFDPQSYQYSWNRAVREDFVELSQNHGRCQIEGKPRLEDPLHAEFRLACERGAIRFDVLLSPTTPPRVQSAEYTEELPSDERVDAAAKLLAGAVSDPEVAFRANLFSPSLERTRAAKTLRRLALSHGACTVEHGGIEVRRSPWKTERAARYVLACTEGLLELSFVLDQNTARVSEFDAHPPRAVDATCWQ